MTAGWFAKDDNRSTLSRHTKKIKETHRSRLLWVDRFGGCLQIERLRSSGAKSSLLHLLACGVRCGMDALHFELEVVWIAGVL